MAPSLPHPPAVSIMSSARPLDSVVQMARRVIGSAVPGSHTDPMGASWGGRPGMGSLGFGHSLAYPGGPAGASAYGGVTFAPGGWVGPGFTPGGGGSSLVYRTDTGHTIDQYGNTVPTGTYVNSRGETITYAMG